MDVRHSGHAAAHLWLAGARADGEMSGAGKRPEIAARLVDEADDDLRRVDAFDVGPGGDGELPALEGPAAMRRVAEASESRGLVDFFVRYPAAAVERASSACASACWTACLNACELAVAPVTALTLAVCVCTT